MDTEDQLTLSQQRVKELSKSLEEEAVNISGKYSQEEIMNAILNNIQHLIASVVPFSIPPMVISYLKNCKLSKQQLDVLLSIAVKVVAYIGMSK